MLAKACLGAKKKVSELLDGVFRASDSVADGPRVRKNLVVVAACKQLGILVYVPNSNL